MVVVFICLTIAYTLAIFLTIYLGLLTYYGIQGSQEHVNQFVIEKMKEWFLVFELDGLEFSLKTFYYLVLGLLFVLLLFYMLYFIFVKGYFKKLYYQPDVNTSKTEAPEFSNATKFAAYFGIYITMTILFLFLLMSMYYLSGSQLMFSCILYIIIFMMFTLLIYNYTMERNNKNIGIIFAVFFVYVILHMMFLI
jgi:hypothetical protein